MNAVVGQVWHDTADWMTLTDRLSDTAAQLDHVSRRFTPGFWNDEQICGRDPGGVALRRCVTTGLDAMTNHWRATAVALDAHARMLVDGSSALVTADGGAGARPPIQLARSHSARIDGTTRPKPVDDSEQTCPPMVAEVLPQAWPTGSVTALRAEATEARRAGAALRNAGTAVCAAAETQSRGAAAQAMRGTTLALCAPQRSELAIVADGLDTVAALAMTYATEIESTRKVMADIEAQVDADRRRAKLLSMLGTEPLRVEPTPAARVVLAAAAREFENRAADVGRAHEQAATAAAASSQSATMAPLTSSIGALGNTGTPTVARRWMSLPDTDPRHAALSLRAANLSRSLPPGVTMAIGVIELRDARNPAATLVATSEAHGYLRRGIELHASEELLVDGGDPIAQIGAAAQRRGGMVAVAVPISGTCSSSGTMERLLDVDTFR